MGLSFVALLCVLKKNFEGTCFIPLTLPYLSPYMHLWLGVPDVLKSSKGTGPLFLGFIAFLFTSLFQNVSDGPVLYLSPALLPLPPSVT